MSVRAVAANLIVFGIWLNPTWHTSGVYYLGEFPSIHNAPSLAYYGLAGKLHWILVQSFSSSVSQSLHNRLCSVLEMELAPQTLLWFCLPHLPPSAAGSLEQLVNNSHHAISTFTFTPHLRPASNRDVCVVAFSS